MLISLGIIVFKQAFLQKVRCKLFHKVLRKLFLPKDLSQKLATQLIQDLSTNLPSDLAFGIFRKNLVIHLPPCQLYPKYKRLLKAK